LVARCAGTSPLRLRLTSGILVPFLARESPLLR
jgi:hypothetical protein